jgi:glycosyltransferase involved in cell wall biosynthesis
MQLLLIKIGKALKTLRRDGIFKGGKRVITAFFALFRFVGKGDVLFVTGGVGDSARYRCQHVSEELELNGIHCATTVQDNPLLPNYADRFKVFIFHRVLFTPSVAKLIERVKQQGKEIIFETDDLVYDPEFLQFMDYFKQMNVFEKKLYENGVGGEILKDPCVKVCTTTTTYLAQKLKENNKQVFIVPNKLCIHDLQVAEKILEAKKENENKEIKIGYFSGNLSHNKDFATINDALMQLMEKYSQVQLYLAGPLDLENKLSKFSDRIGQFPYVQRDKHFANVASVDINVAPLEIGNPFCESKSELKFFEAGIVNVPTVAAATAPFVEAIEDGVDGFVANGTQQWFEKLEKLVIDSELRKSIGEKARVKALEKYATSNANNEQYYAYLKSKINF